MSEQGDDELRERIEKALESSSFRAMSPAETEAFLAEVNRRAVLHEAESAAAGKRFVSEENDKDEIAKWHDNARNVTADTLARFVRELAENYHHDYGTIVHACAAAMMAAFSAVNKSPCGGITGFQASCLFWMLAKNLMHMDGPARLLRFEDALYPQYERRWREIDSKTWAWMQEQARAKLAARGGAHPHVVAHWQSIADGNVPFGLEVSDAT